MAATLPTASDLAALGRDTLRADLDPTGERPPNLEAGSDLDVAISLGATLWSRVARHSAERSAARSRTSATGADLDVVAEDVYYDSRKLATSAMGTVYLERVAGAETSIPEGSRFAVPATTTQRQVYFEATETIAVATGVLEISVPVRCVEDGALGNVELVSIAQIVDPLPDGGWSLYVPDIGNAYFPPDDIGGGADEETDDQLQQRLAVGSPDDRRVRGTKRAVLVGALRVAGVAFAAIVEPGDGTMVLYAGDSSYQLPSQLRSAILTELENWRGAPVYVRPFLTTAVPISLTIHMSQASTLFDVGGIRSDAQAAIAEYFAARERADEYFLDRISAAAASVHPQVQTVVLTAPAADQPRQSEEAYGNVTSLTRYVANAADIQVFVAGPLTS